MGSSFQWAVPQQHFQCLPVSRLSCQRSSVGNPANNISSGGSKRIIDGVLLLRWRNSNFVLLAKHERTPRRINRLGRPKVKCCETGAAEADLLISDGKSTTEISLESTEYNSTGSLHDSARSSKRPDAQPIFAADGSLSTVLDSPCSVVTHSTGQLDDGNEVRELVSNDDDRNLLQQLWDIVVFAGPALGIWLSGPLMSLIDTAVVGRSSSLELAALGPGTVLCDQLGYVFMFLSVATSNLIATSLAKQDESRAAQHLSRLLFVALICGVGMFLATGTFAEPFLKKFTGHKDVGLTSAAFSYVKIRSYAWPAVLVGMVAQSASLGMQDSWSPLQVLALASFVNLTGDILLCTYMGQGIAGAAWATMLSQYVGGFLMLRSLRKKGYSLALTVPSVKELVHMVGIAGPVLFTMLSKVSFYALITYLSTSLGAVILGAHQVMIGIYSTCTVSGEPLCQTAQSFMPALIQGKNANKRKAQMLLKSLLMIGGILGLSLGCFALSFSIFFPRVFTTDIAIINQMRAISLPFFCALIITPPLLSLEGTLLAGRDLKFLSLSMISCFGGGAVLLLVMKRLGFGLPGFWWTLACFQAARYLSSFWRLQSSKSVLKDSEPKLKAEFT